MKIKHALIILGAGFCLGFVASLLKILHAPSADNYWIVATILKVVGVIVLVYKILTNPKAKEFLNL